MMKRKTLQDFGIFCNRCLGEHIRREDIHDTLNRMTKRHKEFWSHIQWKDQEGRTITVTREFFEDQGMTIEEIIEDWLQNASPEQLAEDIHTLKGTSRFIF